MFELGGPLPVACRGSPLVSPGEVLPRALVDHGLDREDVALLHEADCLILSVVWHLGSLMEDSSDAVASV